MAGEKGDGRVGFFETRLFDLTRSPEGRALVQEDRLARAQRGADKSRARADAGKEAAAEVVEEPVVEVVAANGATTTATLRGQFMRALRKSSVANAETNAAQDEVIQDIIDHVRAMKAAVDLNEERLMEIYQFLKKQKAERNGQMSMLGTTLVPLMSTFVDVINVGDVARYPLALAAGEAVEGLIKNGNNGNGFLGIDGDNAVWGLIELIAKVIGHYDPAVGLMSAFQNDTGTLIAPVSQPPSVPVSSTPAYL